VVNLLRRRLTILAGRRWSICSGGDWIFYPACPLKKISDRINLYASVIDLNNTSKEVFEENIQDKTNDELRKSVLLSIIISTEFKWKKEIEVIQLRQYSEYSQNGIVNNWDDIKPFAKKKPNN